jgi:hypothetical protein
MMPKVMKEMMDISDPEWRRIIRWHIENKCSEDGCKNYRMRGYIFCEGHLHGFPRRIDDDWFEAYEKLKLFEDV